MLGYFSYYLYYFNACCGSAIYHRVIYLALNNSEKDAEEM